MKTSRNGKRMSLQDILNNLTDDEKEQLKQQLGTETTLNIILCDSAQVNNGVSIQINDRESVKSALEKIPPESLAEILKAIADVVAKKKV